MLIMSLRCIKAKKSFVYTGAVYTGAVYTGALGRRRL